MRLCEGIYYSISFATPRNKFPADRGERHHPSRSGLSIDPGKSFEQMNDLDDEPYIRPKG
jgi:hypothetical protein